MGSQTHTGLAPRRLNIWGARLAKDHHSCIQSPRIHAGRLHSPSTRGEAMKQRLQCVPVLWGTRSLCCVKWLSLPVVQGTDKRDSPSSSPCNLGPCSRHSHHKVAASCRLCPLWIWDWWQLHGCLSCHWDPYPLKSTADTPADEDTDWDATVQTTHIKSR